MKYLLSILCLFVLSCDGGSDSLTEDCSGLLGGNAYINECSECMCGDNDPDLWECDDDDECEQDCNGEWGGDAEIDECGICGGDNTNSCGSCTDYVELWGECYNISQTTNLNLSDSQIEGEIPSKIGRLTNLVYLQLHNNQLYGEIPIEIAALTNLSWLVLNNNDLTSLPSNIGDLSNLTSLNIENNQLTSLPESIGNLNNLHNLFVTGNLLTSLPSNICNLANIWVGDNLLCDEYYFECMTDNQWGNQNQSNCP